jgi:geranylgeranyl reductase family protein
LYDVIIVGGGPSGASAARKAATLGLNVLLFERENFPRNKPCGGALSEQAIRYLDFEIPKHLQEKDIFGARVHYKNQSVEKIKSHRISTLVTRGKFDTFLLDKAIEKGIEISQGEEVKRFNDKGDYIQVFTKSNIYTSKFLILADGYPGKLSSQIRGREPKDMFATGVVTEIPADNRIIDAYIHNAIDIHFGVSDWGYGWVFPHDGYFSVGIAGLTKHIPYPKKTFTDFLATLPQDIFKGDYEIHGHLIPAGGYERNIVGNRTLLVGDAAGFVDPFYGEGIAYAIKSGQIAAELIQKIIINENNRSTLNDYPAMCQREFGNNLRYSLYLSQYMHRFPKLFFKAFVKNEELVDKWLDVPSIKTSYEEFIKWCIPRSPKYLINALV